MFPRLSFSKLASLREGLLAAMLLGIFGFGMLIYHDPSPKDRGKISLKEPGTLHMRAEIELPVVTDSVKRRALMRDTLTRVTIDHFRLSAHLADARTDLASAHRQLHEAISAELADEGTERAARVWRATTLIQEQEYHVRKLDRAVRSARRAERTIQDGLAVR